MLGTQSQAHRTMNGPLTLNPLAGLVATASPANTMGVISAGQTQVGKSESGGQPSLTMQSCTGSACKSV